MKRYLLTMVIMLSLFGLAACNEDPKPVEPPIRPVKTVTAKPYDKGKRWTFSGTAEDALATDLSFRVGGKIIAFPGDQIGRKFAEGDVIARIDPSDYELEVRQARANLEQVRANYVRAKADLKRNAELFKRHVISKGELDQIEADFKSYDAQLKASSKQLDIAQKRLSYTTLHAPFNGWIGKVQANIHQNVSAGQAIASFNAGRQMKMFIGIPDVLITHVHEGDPVEVVFDAVPGQSTQGTVEEISVDSTVGSTYPVKVYLENEGRLIRSGMSGHVNFIGKTTGTTFFLPPVAVMSESDGSRAIYVVNQENSTVEERKVTIGKLTSLGLEVQTGVQAGDMVVIRGVHSLKDGMKVRFTQSSKEG